MLKKLMIAAVAMQLVVGIVAAAEFDAVIDDASRAFTKMKKSADKLVYGKLTLDSKGKVVSTAYKEGLVTKDTNVVMGSFDAKEQKWKPGAAIEGGIRADIFKEEGAVVQIRVAVEDDNKTIGRILVKKDAKPLVQADREFEAVLKHVGPQTNGAGGIWYTRLELDDKGDTIKTGDIIKTFALTSGWVTKDTKVVMGKYNEKTKKWEAGDAIANRLYNDLFKDPGAKTIYVRITPRADRRGIAQILVRQIGESDTK